MICGSFMAFISRTYQTLPKMAKPDFNIIPLMLLMVYLVGWGKLSTILFFFLPILRGTVKTHR